VEEWEGEGKKPRGCERRTMRCRKEREKGQEREKAQKSDVV
jgi:hypothetical protein